MKFIITLLLGVIVTSYSAAQGSIPALVEDYAWGGDYEDRLMDVIELETDYSIISAGHSNSSKTGEVSEKSNGLSDFWILKMDTNKNIVFDHTLGSDTAEIFSTLLQTPDGGFLLAGSSAGGSNGDKTENSKGGFDFWIVKISKDGNILWDKTIGGAKNDFLNSAVLTVDDGFLLGGVSESNISGDKSDNSYGNEDYWLVKVNSSGNVVWDKTIGGDTTDILENIVVVNNEIFVSGSSASDSSGLKSSDSYGGFDFWILKLNLTGDLLDQWIYGGIEDDFCEEIRKHTLKKTFWVAGTTFSKATGNKISTGYGNADFWVFMINDLGDKSIDKTFGSSQSDICKDMEVSPEGAAIIAGFSSGSDGNKSSGTNGGEDYWIIKVDTLGDKFWDVNYGGTDNDSLQAIFIKCDRGILVGGHSLSGISGDRTHYSRGMNDYWVLKLDIPTRPNFKVTNVCSGVPLKFLDESDVWPDTWKWDFDDEFSANNASNDQHPFHTYSEPGVYNVKMTIKEGCQNDTSLVRSITVYKNTVLGNLELGQSFSVCEGTVFQLENQENAPSGVTYNWSSGDSTSAIEKSALGVYTVTMSDRNCSVVDSIEVGDCPTLFIPNTFTPNKDALNDVFFVKGFGIVEFELLVFNRWGQLIFKSNDINHGWDGTLNGRNVQIDVYVYKVWYGGVGTGSNSKIGHVSLIR
tara:strand:- start:6143 stop:8212 length:2070 start_codon:yes stop_codon:yes gene_type:complete